MRLLFVGLFNHTSGSSQTVIQFARVGQAMGHQVRVSGRLDASMSRLFPPSSSSRIDYVIFVVENFCFVNRAYLRRMERVVPRSQRIVIDTDGKLNRLTRHRGDSNHQSDDGARSTQEVLRDFATVLLQPTFHPQERDVRPFLFFGFPESLRPEVRKDYGLGYVGNNWHRWNQLVDLIDDLSDVRDLLGPVRVCGSWWNGASYAGNRTATMSLSGVLKRKGVEVRPPVPTWRVIHEMSKARINPILMRPVLSRLGLMTPRMFETFAADTIPFLPPDAPYLQELYGAEARALTAEKPAELVRRILDDPEKYERALTATRSRLARSHSYVRRFSELLEVIGVPIDHERLRF